jgi:hypothetical protein
MSIETTIKHFESQLGDEICVSPKKLVDCGLFGSINAVKNALKKGLIPSIKVSSHRTLIPKSSVLDHLRGSCISLAIGKES